MAIRRPSATGSPSAFRRRMFRRSTPSTKKASPPAAPTRAPLVRGLRYRIPMRPICVIPRATSSSPGACGRAEPGAFAFAERDRGPCLPADALALGDVVAGHVEVHAMPEVGLFAVVGHPGDDGPVL